MMPSHSLGFGFAHSYDKPHLNSLAFNFGLINTFHVADAWDLNLELYGMGAENKFDGKTLNKGLDVMLGASVGVTYKFPQRGFKPAPDVDAMMALTASQMDAINAALAQQIEQNRQLKAQLANTPNESCYRTSYRQPADSGSAVCILPNWFCYSASKQHSQLATDC